LWCLPAGVSQNKKERQWLILCISCLITCYIDVKFNFSTNNIFTISPNINMISGFLKEEELLGNIQNLYVNFLKNQQRLFSPSVKERTCFPLRKVTRCREIPLGQGSTVNPILNLLCKSINKILMKSILYWYFKQIL
jgi:hypothetical protein